MRREDNRAPRNSKISIKEEDDIPSTITVCEKVFKPLGATSQKRPIRQEEISRRNKSKLKLN